VACGGVNLLKTSARTPLSHASGQTGFQRSMHLKPRITTPGIMIPGIMVPGITVSGTPGISDLPTLGRTSHGKSPKLALLTTGTMMTMGKVCAPEYKSIYIVCM
jgi:hypothetical protein